MEALVSLAATAAHGLKLQSVPLALIARAIPFSYPTERVSARCVAQAKWPAEDKVLAHLSQSLVLLASMRFSPARRRLLPRRRASIVPMDNSEAMSAPVPMKMCLRVRRVTQADFLTREARKKAVFLARRISGARLQEIPLFRLQVKCVRREQKASLQRQRRPKPSVPLAKPVDSSAHLWKSASPVNLAGTVVAVELTAAAQSFVFLLTPALQAVTADLVQRRGSKHNASHVRLASLATVVSLATAALVVHQDCSQIATEQRRANALSVQEQARLVVFLALLASLAPSWRPKPLAGCASKANFSPALARDPASLVVQVSTRINKGVPLLAKGKLVRLADSVQSFKLMNPQHVKRAVTVKQLLRAQLRA